MTFDQAIILGTLIAACLAALFGKKRGDQLNATSHTTTASTTAQYALVGSTLADSAMMQRQIEVTGRLADAMEGVHEQLIRHNDAEANSATEQRDRMIDALQRLEERLEEEPPRRRR